MMCMTADIETRRRTRCVWDPNLRGDIMGLVVLDDTGAWRSIDGNLMVVEVELSHGGWILLPYHVGDIVAEGPVWARSDDKAHTNIHEALRAAHDAWDARWA